MTYERVCGVDGTPKEGRRRKRYMADEWMGKVVTDSERVVVKHMKELRTGAKP